MNRELFDKLDAEFPQYFAFVKEHFGIECNSGWFDIIHEMCVKLKALLVNPGDEGFTFHQVKEKFGELRVYPSRSTPEIEKILDEAVAKSLTVCEVCGSTTDVKTQSKYGWISTECAVCYGTPKK